MLSKKSVRQVLAGAVLFSGLTACAQSGLEIPATKNRAAVESGLNVLRTSQLPDGAFRMKGLGDEVKIVPYFANFAAMALLAGNEVYKNPADVERVRRWLDWYVSHQEKNGIIYDYFGTKASYSSKGTCDSTDSYAATFLMTLWRYQQAVQTPLDPKFVDAAALALQAIEEVVQPDGLTITKPDYAIKYLMDNIEVYQGLEEGALLFGLAGQENTAMRAREMAKRIAKSFGSFWSEDDQCFAYAMDMNGKLLGGFLKPYPHGLAQLFALAHCIPAPAGLWDRVNETFKPDNDGLPVERWLMAAIRCGDEAGIKKYRDETRKALLKFTAQNIEIHRPAIAILALIDGGARFPDVPLRNSLQVDHGTLKIQAEDRPAIKNGLNIIRQSQLFDGAFRLSSAGDDVQIVPYFSNFAAMALLAANDGQANPQDVKRVRRWLDWYVAHQEPDGTIFDYAGTVATYISKGTCDSTDSYAATFLMVLWRYQQTLGTALPAHDMEAAVKALGAIKDVMQPDGLTIAKPDYAIKYLMDNVEVYQGLDEGARLFESAGLTTEASEARKMAADVANRLPLFWSQNDQCFAYAADMNNKLFGGFEKPYPHGLAQLFALAHCIPTPSGLWERVCETFASDNLFDSYAKGMTVERWLLAATRCGDVDEIKKYRDGTRKALLEFTVQNSQIHQLSINVLALIDGNSRFPDVPLPEHLCAKRLTDTAKGEVRPASETVDPCNKPEVTPYAKLAAHYDVIVAGGGTSGIMAAIQAAKLGASVLVLEETDWIGGQMAAAAVTSMDEGSESTSAGVSRNDVRERGLYREFYQRAVAHYDRIGLSSDTCYISANHFATEPRVAQQILYNMVRDTRLADPDVVLDISLISKVIGVTRDGNRVTGVDVELGLGGADGTRSIGSRILIDATEWGDILPLAKIPYRIGNWISEEDHSGDTNYPPLQGFTWTAVIRDYGEAPPADLIFPEPPDFMGTRDVPPATYASLIPQFKEAFDTVSPKKSTKPWSWERFIGYRGMPDSQHPNVAVTNDWAEVTRTHVNISANDRHVTTHQLESPEARFELEYELKLRTLQVLYYLRNDMKSPQKTWAIANDEGYNTPYNRYRTQRLIDAFDKDGMEDKGLSAFRNILVQMPVIPYVRESRRMIAEHVLTAREIDRRTGPQDFKHAVAIGDYGVDLHGADTPDVIELDLDRPDDVKAIGFAGNKVGPFQIPMECFYPPEVDGFLAAEKNIGQSRLVNGATRLQPSTMLIGQAAGAIAGVSVRENLAPRDLRPALIQQVLLDAGDVLYAKKFEAQKFDGVEIYSDLWKSVQFAFLYKILETSDRNPAQAYWRAEAGGFGSPGWHMTADRDLAFDAVSGVLIYTNDFFNGENAAERSDYSVQATLRRSSGGGPAGLVARYVDRSNYFHARIFDNKLQLYEWVNGQAVLRETTASGYVNGENWNMVMNCKGAEITVELRDEHDAVRSELKYTQATPRSGYAGVRAQPGAGNQIVYSGFRVESPDDGLLAEETFPEGLNVAEGILTRAWLAKFLVRQLGVQVKPIYTKSFKDVPPGHPAARFIEAAVDAGFMTGEQDVFAPDRAVTRADLAIAMAKAYRLNVEVSSEPLFSDVTVSHPAFKEIQALVAAGIAEGVFNRDPNGLFKPDEKVFVRDYLAAGREIILEGVEPAF